MTKYERLSSRDLPQQEHKPEEHSYCRASQKSNFYSQAHINLLLVYRPLFKIFPQITYAKLARLDGFSGTLQILLLLLKQLIGAASKGCQLAVRTALP